MKLHVPFLQLPLAFDAAALASEIQALGENPWRPHPQGFPGNSALTLITANGDPDNDDVAGPMLPTPNLRRCPYLMQVLAAIGGTWGRSRLMRLSGQAEVTPHVDINYYWRERFRVHVPITTQPTVRFLCGDAQLNMKAGECWIFDTWRVHNVINDNVEARLHLVADTVGGEGFWQHVLAGRPHDRQMSDWHPRLVPPQPSAPPPALDYESRNVPAVMTPWEIREHAVFLLGEAMPDPKLSAVQQSLLMFARRWHALWSCYGESREGWTRYRALLDQARAETMACGAREMALRNGIRLMQALAANIFDAALADRANRDGEEHRQNPKADPMPTSAAARHEGRDSRFDRPVFIVSPPRSGSTLLFETLARAPNVFTIGDESHHTIEGIAELNPTLRGFHSNRLTAEDANPAVAASVRDRFFRALRDRDGSAPAREAVRMLEKTPKNSLRVPFLAKVFPEARFIYLYRDPRQVLSSMIEAWSSGRFRTYADLPGWSGLPWSLLLVPGWRELAGKPLHEIVAAQWRTTTQTLLDDLERLPADRWAVAKYHALQSQPTTEICRLCDAVGLDWDRGPEDSLPLSRYTVSPPAPDKWRRHQREIEEMLPFIEDQARRAESVAAR